MMIFKNILYVFCSLLLIYDNCIFYCTEVQIDITEQMCAVVKYLAQGRQDFSNATLYNKINKQQQELVRLLVLQSSEDNDANLKAAQELYKCIANGEGNRIVMIANSSGVAALQGIGCAKFSSDESTKIAGSGSLGNTNDQEKPDMKNNQSSTNAVIHPDSVLWTFNIFWHNELSCFFLNRCLALGAICDISVNFKKKCNKIYCCCDVSDISRIQVSPSLFVGVNVRDFATIKLGPYVSIYRNYHDQNRITNYNHTIGLFIGLDLNLQKMFGLEDTIMSLFVKIGIYNICRHNSLLQCKNNEESSIKEKFVFGMCFSYFSDLRRYYRVKIGAGISCSRYKNDEKYFRRILY